MEFVENGERERSTRAQCLSAILNYPFHVSGHEHAPISSGITLN